MRNSSGAVIAGERNDRGNLRTDEIAARGALAMTGTVSPS